MPFDPAQITEACKLCGAPCNPHGGSGSFSYTFDCSRCGDYEIGGEDRDAFAAMAPGDKWRALVSHNIRKAHAARLKVDLQFLLALKDRPLPSPAEACDNLLQYLGALADGRAGRSLAFNYSNVRFIAEAGVVDQNDLAWVVATLAEQGFLSIVPQTMLTRAEITATGWLRIEALRNAKVASSFAFFARRFQNPRLDTAYEKCLRPAALETGYDLRLASQKAGLIDAVIEDEIRRCRFLLVDLSDDNAGAYWEAGFAEGLGKDVIYVAEGTGGKILKPTHFDTNHRQTVLWDIDALDETAKNLKAVIRNTLLGDAKQPPQAA